MLDVLELSKKLMSMSTVTPQGAECIEHLIPLLEQAGFSIEKIPCGDALNLWARYGSQKPLACFLGHVDVVPTGPLTEWDSPPFEPEIRDGLLYGRGACDMKTGVAGFVVACIEFVKKNPDFPGSIAIMLTSAEEEMDELGVPNVVERLEARNEKIDYCITGEPSSTEILGDILRNGRRGSVSGNLTIQGKQGHIAYPHLATNPINQLFAPLAELIATTWDKGNKDFPATSLQLSNINSGTGANNIIPGSANLRFNFRYSPEVIVEQLKERTETILNKYDINYDLQWSFSGHPYYTPAGKLVEAATQAIKTVCGITPENSTGGGTSDARFIAPTGAQVIELGVSNKTAHQINEHVPVEQVIQLPKLYLELLNQLLLK
jgi:succinyl-diaminopimelate desuccinylase